MDPRVPWATRFGLFVIWVACFRSFSFSGAFAVILTFPVDMKLCPAVCRASTFQVTTVFPWDLLLVEDRKEVVLPTLGWSCSEAEAPGFAFQIWNLTSCVLPSEVLMVMAPTSGVRIFQRQ